MQVIILGSGDAFGSGGRLNTFFCVQGKRTAFLIDCRASAMVSIRRFEVDPNSIDAILISHLHGDHFGGLPFFILDAQLVSKRQSKLVIAGPIGLTKRLEEAMEVFFAGSSKTRRKFGIEIVELLPTVQKELPDQLKVTGYEVNHPSGAPSLALRVEFEGATIAYTGDTDWVDALVPATQNADLLIAEAYNFDRQVPFHLDYRTLSGKLPDIRPKRLILTHMSSEMLARIDEADCEAAYDGMKVEIASV